VYNVEGFLLVVVRHEECFDLCLSKLHIQMLSLSANGGDAGKQKWVFRLANSSTPDGTSCATEFLDVHTK
jgi:hypothetical protein